MPFNYEDLLAQYRDLNKQEDDLVQPSMSEAIQQPVDEMNQFQEAQKARDISQLINRLGRSAEIIGSGISGAKPVAQEAFAENIRAAESIPEDVIKRQEAEKFDPKSSISEVYKERLKKSMPEIAEQPWFKDLSAAHLEKLGVKVGEATQGLRFERITDPNTGEVKLVGINPITGEISREIGEAGFAAQYRVNPRTKELISLSPSKPSTLPKAITSPKAKEEDKEEITYQNLDVRKQDKLDRITERLEKDETYKGGREAVQGAKNAKLLLQQGKVQGADIVRAIQNMLARATGERGVMTEQDVAPFGGPPAIIDRLQRAASIATKGQLPDEDRQFLMSFSDALEKAGNRKIVDAAKPYIAETEQKIEVNKKSAQKLLNIQERISMPENRVKVQLPNGKVGFIPKENVEKAIQKGAKVLE